MFLSGAQFPGPFLPETHTAGANLKEGGGVRISTEKEGKSQKIGRSLRSIEPIFGVYGRCSAVNRR